MTRTYTILRRIAAALAIASLLLAVGWAWLVQEPVDWNENSWWPEQVQASQSVARSDSLWSKSPAESFHGTLVDSRARRDIRLMYFLCPSHLPPQAAPADLPIWKWPLVLSGASDEPGSLAAGSVGE